MNLKTKVLPTVSPRKKNSNEDTQIVSRTQIEMPGTMTSDAAGLVVIYGSDNFLGKKIELPRAGELIMGRSSSADINLDHFGVSREHARISIGPDGYAIYDLGSTNGTFVNNEPLKTAPVLLHHGDRIQLGVLILKFITGGDIELLYHEEIYKLVSTDGMLRIPNRRNLMEQVQKEMSRCRRHRRHLSLAMFDIDHFKNINDTYGHLAGDFVLRDITERVRGNLRKEDTFGRYGGEEFVILMPEVPLAGAAVVGEKIRRLIAETPFDYIHHSIPVTVSIGIAIWTPEIETVEQFIKIADNRLYKGKRSGRNIVVTTDD